MPEEENKDKWAQFIAGDKEAYGWIYRTNIQDLYRYGLRFTANTELIKDSVQEVFTAIYRNRKRLPVPDNVSVYLFVSLKNKLIRMMQRESFYKDDDLESVPFSLEPTVEEQYIEQETQSLRQKQLKEILSLLSPRQQEIIYYRYIKELSLDEICSIMSLNYQSAQNLIQRSLKKIREAFPH
ncbi:MAG: sigma-70 family RNA polymerase sigma factor [Tannerellaceae bacterium]|jgi:RNA polymerase sigma factor (sigma-70 family)|nr:sigma-70 family RNA polymerase sigma factor [Tannerellaceae bacterium]